MAIGRPINQTGNLATTTISITASANQTGFLIPGGYGINNIDVFRNGVKLTPQSDFQAFDGSTVTLTTSANLNDELSFKVYNTFSVADAIVGAASSQTINGDLTVTGTLFSGTIEGGVGSAGTWTNYDNNTGVTTTSKVKIQNDFEVTGVSTFADVNATIGSFSGNLSIGGTLTYQDVTNIDAVGLITARSGVNITDGGLRVTGVSTFNDGLRVTGVSTFNDDIKGDGSTNISGISSVTSDELFGDTSKVVSGKWILGANGSNHYTFTGPGLIGAEDDPTIYLQRGMKYQFVNNMGAHGFRIQSDPNGATGGTQYNDGITNNDVSNGTLEWDVQFDAPDTLFYQCTAHNNMGGIVYIGDGVRSIPQVSKTSSYTLIASDTGKHITITTGGITVPSSIFSIGDAISIYNNSSGNQTITEGGGVTIRQAGTSNTGNRTLGQYGLVTLLCVDTNIFVISGGGLS